MRTRILGAALGGLGLPAAVGLLIPMEAGVPIPVPDDLVMLVIGERVAAGRFSLWAAIIGLEVVAIVGTAALFFACRGPGYVVVRHLGPRIGLTTERLDRATAVVETRGRTALALGRSTPGMRTITVVAAGASGLRTRNALPALIVGSSIFVQLHLFLGLILGPAALDAFNRAKGLAVLAAVLLLAGAAVFWIVRRGRRGGARAWTEAACPVCLALASVNREPSQPPAGERVASH